MRRALFFGGVGVVVVAVTVLVARGKVKSALAAPAPGDRTPHYVLIPPKSSVAGIARQLRRENLIRDGRAFQLAARYLELDHRLQAGGYRLTRAEGAVPILRKLAAGKVYVRKLTLPEGLTVREVAERLERGGFGRAATFRALATGTHRLETRPAWAPAGSLEGYLFPETYQVPLGVSEAELLGRLLTRFGQVVVAGQAKQLKAQPLTLHEVVTLASIVEREAKLPREQPLMARVFLNRLRLGMELESCATVQYALPHRKARLLYRDLEVQSPYNTYLHAGLPPGPIASPGGSALAAVLKPAQTSALYFVARPEGSHVFSQTFAEHEAAKAALRRAAQQTPPPA
jgi:UPF0755 protein